MKWLLYGGVSFTLLFIGEYSSFVVFQIVAPLVSRHFFYSIYLPFIHFTLLQVFASLHYPLYFFLLGLVVSIIYQDKSKMYFSRLLRLSFVYSFLFLIAHLLQDDVYDLYLWSNLQDRVNYISEDVVSLLTLFHLFILFFLTFEYNGKKMVRL